MKPTLPVFLACLACALAVQTHRLWKTERLLKESISAQMEWQNVFKSWELTAGTWARLATNAEAAAQQWRNQYLKDCEDFKVLYLTNVTASAVITNPETRKLMLHQMNAPIRVVP